MKISVIIPVYNCKKYLSNCIESVLNQSYEDLEIIIVDDGSTDGSGKICDDFLLKDERICVIHQENQGVSSARNQGLKIAGGDYISFIDSDDTLDSDMYEILINLINNYHVDIAHCGFKRIEGGIVTYASNTEKVYVQNRNEALECLITGRLFGNGLWNKLFRRNVIEGVYFNEKLKINEDVLYNFQVFSKADEIVYLDAAKYNYIVHEKSACFITSSEKKLSDVCKVSKYILNELEGTELASIARTRYLQMLGLYFRICMSKMGYENERKRKQLSEEMRKQISKGDVYQKGVLLTSKMIQWCPHAYCFIHNMYDKLKKPNWAPK